MEINPRWKIIDEYHHKGIIPEALKGLTIKELIAGLKNIPTKISRLNTLLKKETDMDKIVNYKLQLEVHKKDLFDYESILKQVGSVSIDHVKQLI